MTPALAATGLFPKMPPARVAYVVNCAADSNSARKTARALEGLINQKEAEAYIYSRPEDQEQLIASGRRYVRLPALQGDDSGLRTLFSKYSSRVKKMVVYDPNKDWTFYLALMSSAQGYGIPVTAAQMAMLSSEFGWKGTVEDLRNEGSNRISGYDWALLHLMPVSSRKVVFVLDPGRDRLDYLIDYAFASKGFAFWLDFGKADELAEARKIFAFPGYTIGTSLMGYASNGDDANIYANPDAIGYVVSDYYANGSFWSSFPDKTYQQPTKPQIKTVVGKIYVSLIWSDGDNISFDQQATYRLWHDASRGTIPVATTLSPTLQELNTPLLDWYYAKMTRNDELISGPSGVQFVFGDSYKPGLFPRWCELSDKWVNDAGFNSVYFWRTQYPGHGYASCVDGSSFAGVIHSFSNSLHGQVRYELGMPVVDGESPVRSAQSLFESLARVAPRPDAPVFLTRDLVVGSFTERGYDQVQSVVARLNAEYPGRFVYMLPTQLFAAIRSYYRLAPAHISNGTAPHS